MFKLSPSKEKYTAFIYNLEGYKMKIKKNNIQVFYEPWLEKIVSDDFEPEYHKLVARILELLNDESDGDAAELLQLLEEIRMVFYHKYEKYLDPKIIKKYLRQINILKTELSLLTYKKEITTSRSR